MSTSAPHAGVAGHPELESEQAYIDYAYERLRLMREAALEMRRAALEIGATEMRPIDPTGEDGLGGIMFEREAFYSAGIARAAQLDVGRNSLVFGRMDRDDGERYYLGRLAVSGPEREPVVVDWRAPVAEAFYRATGRHPLGLHLRRHFICEGRALLGVEDEVFGAEGLEGSGTGALLAALGQVRTGRMRDIVATVQREQDEAIRAPLEGILVVQGGPGTGKTAVALHRAAYLLFSYRARLENHILVIGPNHVFLQYIDQVLPALGESGVAMATIAGLARVSVTGADSADAARVKGDVRMARVIEGAVASRQRPLPEDVTIDYEGHKLVLTRHASASIIRSVRARPGTHNERRRFVERLVFRNLYRQYNAVTDPGRGRSRTDETGENVLGQELRREPVVRRALDRMWPRLSPEELLHDLFGSRALVADASKGILSEAEQASLVRPWAERLRDVAWTLGDAALLDEAVVALGERRRRADAQADEEPFVIYGHIVVDEVQDLTPMQLRMLARRSRGSMTLVGDVAQATGHAAPGSWEEVLRHLPSPRGTTAIELTINYRTPAEIMDYAARVLNVAAPELEPPRSVRETGDHPRVVATHDLPGEVARVASELKDEVKSGTVGVVGPQSLMGELAAALAAAGVEYGEAETDGLLAPVTLVAVDIAKGLEFDAVVVAEPARIAREASGGLRALYVALTRATKKLAVVHGEPLPPMLGAP